MPESKATYSYEAFISYRQIEPDKTVAARLHRALETYRVPRSLVKEGMPRRLKHIFRDKDELAASSNLGENIQEALKQSRFLIVVCSRRTPESEWVVKEIEIFCELGREYRILCLLVEGEPTESFPIPLRQVRPTIVREKGAKHEMEEMTEPLAADIRAHKLSQSLKLLKVEKLRLIAPILGRSFAELEQREAKRRAKRRLQLLAFSFTLLLILSTLLYYVHIQKSVIASRRLASEARKNLETELDLSLLLSIEALRVSNTYEARSNLLAGLLQKPYIVTQLRGHGHIVRALAFSPNGRILASGGFDGMIVLWDAITYQSLGKPLMHPEAIVLTLAFSPDGHVLASGDDDGSIILWDVSTCKSIGDPIIAHPYNLVDKLAFRPDGKVLASAEHAGQTILWDVETRQQLAKAQTGFNEILAFSPDGKILVAGEHNDKSIFWDGDTLKPLDSLVDHSTQGDDSSISGALSPDGRLLAFCMGDPIYAIKIWDLTLGEPMCEPLSCQDYKDSLTFQALVAFSPDSRILALRDEDMALLWNLRDPHTKPLTIQTAGERIHSMAFSPDNSTLATGHSDVIILWDATGEPRLGRFLTAKDDKVWKGTLTPDGRILALGSRNSTIVLWDMITFQRKNQFFSRHADLVSALAFSKDGKILVSGGKDGTIIFRETASWQQIGTKLTCHSGRITSLCFSSNGETLISTSSDDSVRFWSVANYRPIGQSFIANNGGISTVAVCHDGKMMAWANWDDTITVFNIETRQCLDAPFSGHTTDVSSLSISLDGKVLASGDASGKIIIWNIDARAPISLPLLNSTGRVTSMMIAPDSRLLASGDENGNVALWDLKALKRIGKPLKGHSGEISDLAFTSDGKNLVSGDNSSVVLWDIDPVSWEKRACKIANRNFSKEEWTAFMGTRRYRKTRSDWPVWVPPKGVRPKPIDYRPIPPKGKKENSNE